MSFVPITPAGTLLMHLESNTEDEAWEAVLKDAAPMPYDNKQDFIQRGYTVIEFPKAKKR